MKTIIEKEIDEKVARIHADIDTRKKEFENSMRLKLERFKRIEEDSRKIFN